MAGIQRKLNHFSDQFETSHKLCRWYLYETNTFDMSRTHTTWYLKQSDPFWDAVESPLPEKNWLFSEVKEKYQVVRKQYWPI